MNCADFERLIALDAEGDLPKQMAGSVAAHLRTCRQCQEFAVKLETSQSLLKELAQEAPDGATLQLLRRSVLNRLPSEPDSKSFPVWRLAFAAALVAILILTVLALRRPSRTVVTGVIAKTQVQTTREAIRQVPALPKAIPARSLKSARVVKARRSPQRSLPARAKHHPEPLMVKLLTDNPNVVIYWQID